MANTWYEAKTGNHQALVIDEATGENIAVAYDKKHGAILAAAPELLEALELAIKMLEDDYKDGGNQHPTLNRFRAAIAKAKGE